MTPAMPRPLRITKATIQDSVPAGYSIWVKILSFVAFFYAIIAFLNESVFQWLQGEDGSFPFWLSH